MTSSPNSVPVPPVLTNPTPLHVVRGDLLWVCRAAHVSALSAHMEWMREARQRVDAGERPLRPANSTPGARPLRNSTYASYLAAATELRAKVHNDETWSHADEIVAPRVLRLNRDEIYRCARVAAQEVVVAASWLAAVVARDKPTAFVEARLAASLADAQARWEAQVATLLEAYPAVATNPVVPVVAVQNSEPVVWLLVLPHDEAEIGAWEELRLERAAGAGAI